MRKISIFVEGQTERIFVEKLLTEYLTSTKLKTVTCKLRGDRITNIIEKGNIQNPEFYILIYDVGSGEKVVSALMDNAERMISEQGYDYLFALRDLHPVPSNQKEKLINKINGVFNDKFIFANRLRLILAIKEIEAWFLADCNVFSKINPILTPDYIKNNTSYDLVNDIVEDYDNPPEIVNKILKLIGQQYKKKEKDVYKITYRIDYSYLCLSAVTKVISLLYFIKCIDESLY